MKCKILSCILLAVLLLSGCTAPQETPHEAESKEPVVTLRAITLGTEPAGGLGRSMRRWMR